jgi:hypothetical protein
VRHRATTRFWARYRALPPEVQQLANEAYERLRRDPYYPSLHFKRVGRFWSARVGRNHRAVAVEKPDGFVWFWIGTHDEYERLIN